ncbi:MAG: alpha/beta fold hydrolase [Gammaproteobacteria bacterium]
MPYFERDTTRIYYEVHGEGFPLLLLAPGGMRSSIDFWNKVAWNPIEQLSAHYQVIAMDQRNAGRSKAPITANDGWADYTADQVGLLDHLRVDRFHVAGMCIGGSFIMGLVDAIPERMVSAVMLQPIGLDNNRQTFFGLFDGWVDEVRSQHQSVNDEAFASFRQSMFGGDFLFNVSEAFVAQCQVPLLVLMGDDIYHPEVISRKVAELAPQAELVERWKTPEDMGAAQARIEKFLAEHT